MAGQRACFVVWRVAAGWKVVLSCVYDLFWVRWIIVCWWCFLGWVMSVVFAVGLWCIFACWLCVWCVLVMVECRCCCGFLLRISFLDLWCHVCCVCINLRVWRADVLVSLRVSSCFSLACKCVITAM